MARALLRGGCFRNAPSLLNSHKLFLSVGHDEYWSGQQRKNVETARDAGLSLAFFSGNEVFWRTRWEDDFRTLVVYKESQEKAKKDPELEEWTGTWRDGRPINPLGSQPENSLTGTLFTVNAWRNDALEIPSRFSKLRFWRDTSVAEMSWRPGCEDKRVIKPGLLGHEWDEDLDNGHRPPGLVRLSETTVDNVWMIQDYGANYDSGTATHHLVMYRSVSGSLVFGAGTVQWSWGLDPHHDTPGGIPPDKATPTNIRLGVDQMGPEPDIQQATLNMFCDMGVLPGVTSLNTDLHMPSPSADTSKPVITEAVLRCEDICYVDVTAEDEGGQVSLVEFSIKNQELSSWHPAVWRSPQHHTIPLIIRNISDSRDMSLGYSFLHDQDYEIEIRAVDDSYIVGVSIVFPFKTR